MTKKTYKVLSAIKHDGEFYSPGDSVSLDNDHADLLIANGAIASKAKAPAEIKAAKPKAQAKSKPAAKAEKTDADAQGSDNT